MRQGVGFGALENKIKILERRDNAVKALVPLDCIDEREVAVDLAHVEDLTRKMLATDVNGRRIGQLVAVLLGYIPEEPLFHIADGFHRIPAVRAIGETAAVAAIHTCTPESLLDLRILASTHRTVRLPRIVDWVDDAWHQTTWSSKISVTQALLFSFGFLAEHPNAGRKLGLTRTDVDAIREWTQAKCTYWNLDASTLYTYLHTAAEADRELVLRTGDGPLTLTHLKNITRYLPGPDHYPLQHLAAHAIIANKLNASQGLQLSQVLAKTPDVNTAEQLIKTGSWRDMNVKNTPKHKRPKRRLATTTQQQSARSFTEEERYIEALFACTIAMANLAIEIAKSEGRLIQNPEPSPKRGDDEDKSILDDTEIAIVEEVAPETVNQAAIWSEEEIMKLCEQIMKMEPLIKTTIARQYTPLINDLDDIISLTALALIKAARKGTLDRPDEERSGEGIILQKSLWVAIDVMRKRSGRGQRIKTVSLDQTIGNSEQTYGKCLASEEGGYAEVDIQVDTPFVEEQLKKALVLFGPEERLVFTLSFLHRLRPIEIANITNKSPNTVATTLNHVMRKLRTAAGRESGMI